MAARCDAEKATYASSNEGELSRLHVQAGFKVALDRNKLTEVLAWMAPERDIAVLDLGCADGHLTRQVFSGLDSRIARVVGIDCERECIEVAAGHEDGVFAFRCVDAEDGDFADELDKVMDELGIESFDLIFTALALHHMDNRVGILSDLRERMSDGGVIYARSCDDGAITAYPDPDGMVEGIVEGTQATVANDDRTHGRKLFGELTASGFRDIEVGSYLDSTAGMSMEERRALYEDNFAWRRQYYLDWAKASLDEESAEKECSEIRERFARVEEMFEDPGFFFSVGGFVAVGWK